MIKVLVVSEIQAQRLSLVCPPRTDFFRVEYTDWEWCWENFGQQALMYNEVKQVQGQAQDDELQAFPQSLYIFWATFRTCLQWA